MPAAFDVPLVAHHRLVGRWVAERSPIGPVPRHAARQHIERTFTAAVMEMLAPIAFTDLRVTVLLGDDLPPAIAVTCADIGQIPLGWIEKASVLAHTMLGEVAPVGWRAAAYAALEGTLGTVLAIFNFAEMLEELSCYYWDGETTDEGARRSLVEWHGHDPDDLDEMLLPSQIEAKRPDFMTARPDPLKHMPRALADRLRALRTAHAAHMKARSAWMFEGHKLFEYLPEMEESSCLAPLTLVPFDHFARELDDIGRPGMEMGFSTVAGLFELPDAEMIDVWLESFRLGIDVLRAAQDLIDFDPTGPEARL